MFFLIVTLYQVYRSKQQKMTAKDTSTVETVK